MPDLAPVGIRDATRADLPAITDIYNHYVRETPVTFDVRAFTVEDREPWFRAHTDAPGHRLLVAEREGRCVGYAGTGSFRAKPAYDTTVESTIYLAPEEQGRGIGRRLYGALFDAIAEADVHMIVAGVTLPNAASVRLHESFGFRAVGVYHEVGRKFGRYWDVAWFERRARHGA